MRVHRRGKAAATTTTHTYVKHVHHARGQDKTKAAGKTTHVAKVLCVHAGADRLGCQHIGLPLLC